jgi:hypothetical protein
VIDPAWLIKASAGEIANAVTLFRGLTIIAFAVDVAAGVLFARMLDWISQWRQVEPDDWCGRYQRFPDGGTGGAMGGPGARFRELPLTQPWVPMPQARWQVWWLMVSCWPWADHPSKPFASRHCLTSP